MKNRFSLFFKAALISFVMLGYFQIVVAQQEKELEKKLQNFFFDLSLYVDIDVIKTELNHNSEFRIYQDPNRDEKKSIVGTLSKDKNLNPVATGNQFIVLYSGGKKKKNISFKWAINYRLEDLPVATIDFEKLKSEFKPLFVDFTEKLEIGQQKEEVNSLTLKTASKTMLIKLIKYNNFIHTISIEYRDTWRIAPIDILKVKY